jgi:hypothetical protein
MSKTNLFCGLFSAAILFVLGLHAIFIANYVDVDLVFIRFMCYLFGAFSLFICAYTVVEIFITLKKDD